MQIDADFEQTCGRIIATMNEFIQEEENSDPEVRIQSSCSNSSPEIQAQIQHNLDLEIHVQTQNIEIDEAHIQYTDPEFSEQESENQHLEAEFDEGDVAKIQNTPACQKVIEVVENKYNIHSGAEDGVVAKGNVLDVGSADLTKGSSAEKVEGRDVEEGATATVVDGGLQARRFVSLTPPPLLAAVFPWVRDGRQNRDGLQRWPEASVEDGAKATEDGREGRQRRRAETGTVVSSAPVTAEVTCSLNSSEQRPTMCQVWKMLKKQDVIFVNSMTLASNDACDSGTRGGQCVPWLASMVEVSIKREAAIDVAATIRKKGIGAIKFSLLLGLTRTQDFEAHIKEEQAALLNWSSHYNFTASCGQAQFSAATIFCFGINDGLGHKQWDPGGAFYFWAVV
ncbi:hypothetical protein PIB30_063271 [Stylosanthes scabra]|uniref:Uncharacterized protein n=1 Tax=Stylosanthes scabra TaxID=79078 RepID=A0ABU6UK74_9FABA|nr:hypothetical protein [Stylosanthes scabra]